MKKLIKNIVVKKLAICIMSFLILLIVSQFDFEAKAEEESFVTYSLDDNSEITYYSERGAYGRVEYKKKHFTSGSGIKYYTRQFVISIGEINDYTNISTLDADSSIALVVSEDGRSYRKEEVDTSKDFYWYETEPDSAGYITTTYSIDGRLFFELIGNAANNGKNGELYIHHVFAITGGSNSDSWHQEYGVVNHKEYWRYADLFKLRWNDTVKTQQSQNLCKNVPVPFKRNVRSIVCYYDDTNNKPLMTESRMVDFFKDKEGLIGNTINTTIYPEVKINGIDYEVYKSSTMPFVYKWIKVPSGTRNPEETFSDPVNTSYNSNVADGESIKIKNVTNNGVTIPEGVLDNPIETVFNLGNSVSSYTWVVVLYVPVRVKNNASELYVHFFDSNNECEIGSVVRISSSVEIGSRVVINELNKKLEMAGVIGYEIDYASGEEFLAAGSNFELLSSLEHAQSLKISKGRLVNNQYVIEHVFEAKYNSVWIPVTAIPDIIPVYLRYVSNDGITIKECGICGTLQEGKPLVITPENTVNKDGNFYRLASESEYGIRVPKAVYSTNNENLTGINYSSLTTIYELTRNNQDFCLSGSNINPEIKAIKVFLPYVKNEDIHKEINTNVVVSFIDSTSGREIEEYLSESVERSSIFYPKIPSGYILDLGNINYPPRAVSVEGQLDIRAAYSEIYNGGFEFLDFYKLDRCAVQIPNSENEKLCVKIWVPIKKYNPITNVIVKYFSYSPGGIYHLETRVEGSYGFNKDVSVLLKDGIILNQNNQVQVYTVDSIAGILYGNSQDMLWGGASFYSELLNYVDGDNIIGQVENYVLSEDKRKLDFKTEKDGAYHTIYVLCKEISDTTNMLIHYIDADTGEELTKDMYSSYLNSNMLSWTGIEGRLSWGLNINVIRDEIIIDENTYEPIWFSENPAKVNIVENKGCPSGELSYFDYVNNRKIYFCKTCGKLRKIVPLDVNGFETGRQNWIFYDNDNYNDEMHSFNSIICNSAYETRVSFGRDSYIPFIVAYDREYRYCNQALFSVDLSAKTIMLQVEEEADTGLNPFMGWPIKRNEYTEMVLYIPCVKVQKVKEIPVEICYAELDLYGNIKDILAQTQGGLAIADTYYSYSGTSVVEKDGKTYKVIGTKDAFSYDNIEYLAASLCQDNSIGQQAIYDGNNKWSTTAKVKKDVEKMTLYIIVEPENDVVIIPYEPENSVLLQHMEPVTKGKILAKIGTPFDVTRAIPSSEYVFASISAEKFLYDIEIENKTGLQENSITFIQPYTINIYDEIMTNDGTFEKTLVEVIENYATKEITVYRPYSYWKIKRAGIYELKNGRIINSSVEGPMNILFDEVETEFVLDTFDSHMSWDGLLTEEYVLPPIILEGSTNAIPVPPVVSVELATRIAYEITPLLKVRNDILEMGSFVVIDSDFVISESGRTETPNKNINGQSNITSEVSGNYQIPEYIMNKEYDSSGSVEYELIGGIGSSQKIIISDVMDINSVLVHTPVINELILESDNLKYVQALEFDKNITQIVLGESEAIDSGDRKNASNDFKVRINLEGVHRDLPGYRILDTTKYVKDIQIMFEFDVIADIDNDLKQDNDILISAGTWNAVYDSYYVPEWVQEGVYEVHSKVYALNSNEENQSEEPYANISTDSYVVTFISEVQVSGKMYGLTITKVNSSAAEWKNVFVYQGYNKNTLPNDYEDGTLKTNKEFDIKKRYYYSVGTKDELGIYRNSYNDKFIFPLINGSSPAKKGLGILKSGYRWNFKIDTVGSIPANDKSGIIIVPSFYWLFDDGTRQRVDLWYSDTVMGKKQKWIKIGDSVDEKNTFKDYVMSEFSGIPKQEIIETNLIRNSIGLKGYLEAIKKNINVFAYGKIANNGVFKTYTGGNYAVGLLQNKIIKSNEVLSKSAYKQTWYFEYGLPSEWHACPYGFDLKRYILEKGICDYSEDFWYRKGSGQLVVSFEIGLYNENGLVMTYANTDENESSGCCNMWKMQGFVNTRRDSKGKVYNFKEGDIVVVEPDNSIYVDYETDWIN